MLATNDSTVNQLPGEMKFLMTYWTIAPTVLSRSTNFSFGNGLVEACALLET